MRILYLEGDACAPKYVAGALSKTPFEVDLVAGEPLDRLPPDFDVCILSDYPADLLGEPGMRDIVERVRTGAGLVMVGGWRSFGAGGYGGTPVADALPVRVGDADDRVNLPSGAYLEKSAPPHEIVEELDLDASPVITGYNRVTPKREADVVLVAYPVLRARPGETLLFADPVPVLVAGAHGRGRALALATDLAPHWSGGLTDWGGGQVDVGRGEEVGLAYIRFLAQLVAWSGGRAVPEEVRQLTLRAETTRR